LFEGIHTGEKENDQEKGENTLKDSYHVGHELPVSAPVEEDADSREESQQNRPEYERSPLSGPEARELEKDVQLPVGVVGYVPVLELVGEEGIDDAEGSDQEEGENQVDASFCTEYQITPLLMPAHKPHGHTPKGDG